jgi:hypothetical protein
VGQGATTAGLSYAVQRRTCSVDVDNHDRDTVLAYRNGIYLPMQAAMELQQYIWVQMSIDEINELLIKDFEPDVTAADCE